jgi:8-oxo-dGTP pyrophosphatase MutT (NUDIX family)
MAMTFPCIAAARRFDAAAHAPFVIDGRRVGWIRARDVARLARWPDVFEFEAGEVRLAARFDSVDARSMALASPIGALAAECLIPGWRDEIYAIRNRFDDPPLAHIERAASRFFGTMTYAVHLNGVVEYAPATPPRMWIGRRSATKATDPGMLDNVVAGGIGWGLGVEDTLLKECWEEAGMPAELAARAIAGRTAHVLCSLPEGTQAEQIFIYDVPLPQDFVPHNQDGEVAEHVLAGPAQLIAWLRAGEVTIDASLAMLDSLLRHRWLAPDAAPGLDALFAPPPDA